MRELTTDIGEPYYPVPDANNQQFYARYKRLAEQEEKTSGVHFVGTPGQLQIFQHGRGDTERDADVRDDREENAEFPERRAAH